MTETYTLVKKDGTKETHPFLLVNGTEHISDHISRAEFGQHDTQKVIIYEPLIKLFETVREGIGGQIRINSGYRDEEYQAKLYEKDKSGAVAKPGSSPHMYGAAMDLAIPHGWSAEKFASLIRQTSVALGYPMARTGWKMYHGSFVHADLVHMLFQPYTDQKNPYPHQWMPGVLW